MVEWNDGMIDWPLNISLFRSLNVNEMLWIQITVQSSAYVGKFETEIHFRQHSMFSNVIPYFLKSLCFLNQSIIPFGICISSTLSHHLNNHI